MPKSDQSVEGPRCRSATGAAELQEPCGREAGGAQRVGQGALRHARRRGDEHQVVSHLEEDSVPLTRQNAAASPD